jgi:methionine synthase II (cobalamin-independent)
MLDTKFNFLPTIIGSMPHVNADEACENILRFLKDLPAWPQLPKRSFFEDMNVQFSEQFPGIITESKRIFVNHLSAVGQMDELYSDYLADNYYKYGISNNYAAGLHKLLEFNISPLAIKGQITGPVTFGLSITDDNRRAIIYDDLLGDAVPRYLRLKASWQENELHKISKNTIVFIDEPYMSSYGSVGISISGQKVISIINEVLNGLNGLKGIHCCGNTDWPILLSTKTDIISFDAYNYYQSFSLFPVEIQKFLERNGAIAWGIVPNDEQALNKESVASLIDRLEEAMTPFMRKGISFNKLIEHSLLTPSCGLDGLNEEMSSRSLQLLVELSSKLKSKYNI